MAPETSSDLTPELVVELERALRLGRANFRLKFAELGLVSKRAERLRISRRMRAHARTLSALDPDLAELLHDWAGLLERGEDD
jgi:hypothetical protein